MLLVRSVGRVDVNHGMNLRVAVEELRQQRTARTLHL